VAVSLLVMRRTDYVPRVALPGPRFEIRETADADGAKRLKMIGELDLAVGERLKEALRAAADAHDAVLVDLSELDFIDSSGLRVLVLALKHARDEGEELRIERRVSPSVARVIELAGLSNYLWPDHASGQGEAGDARDG
jgi:anti-anti-sigma factor